jgi:menaquinone-dependent protoporphyrinogen IX oxidase
MDKRNFIKTGMLAIGTMLIPGKSKALEFYTTTPKSEWAIVYGTWCGTSRDAGVWISEGMDGIADVFDVRENPDLSKYKHIIIGGSIRSGVTPSELQNYLSKHKDSLKSKIRGMFAVCGNMRQPVKNEQYANFFDKHLGKITGVTNVPTKVFLGRITWGLMEPDTRTQMKSFPGMEEYDNLKRAECMAFGKEIIDVTK